MADALGGKIFFSDAGITLHDWSFTRPASDTTRDYTDATITLKIYPQNKKGEPASASDTPVLTLSIGNGLTRTANDADLQSGSLEITQSQVSTLIGSDTAARFGYRWAITLVGYAPAATARGGGYDGYFVIARPGWAGADSSNVTAEAVIKLA